MDSFQSLRLSTLQKRKEAQANFLKSTSPEKNKRKDEQLIKLVKKKNADKVKFTRFFLKNRLSSELEATINQHIKENPSMKDQTFVGILKSKPFTAEVVKLEEAAAAVVDLPKEEALQILKKQPLAYFSGEDFRMKTSAEEEYQALKEKLDNFFEDNASIFEYLQEEPLSDLYPEAISAFI